jgi:hypothetical protein
MKGCVGERKYIITRYMEQQQGKRCCHKFL